MRCRSLPFALTALLLAYVALVACSDRPTPVDVTLIDGPTVRLMVGETVVVRTSTTPASADVLWTSSDPDVATVTATGALTGRRAGTALVTARLEHGGRSVARSLAVEVTPPPAPDALALAPRRATLAPGGAVTFVATGAGDEPALTWTTTCGTLSPTDGTAAYVAPDPAPADGTCRVEVAHADGSADAHADVRVVARAPTVRLTPRTSTLTAGRTARWTADVTRSGLAVEAPDLTWSATCGSIDGDGTHVTYRAPDTVPADGRPCLLRATWTPDDGDATAPNEEGVRGEAAVAIQPAPPPGTLLLAPTEATLAVGETVALEVSASDLGPAALTWSATCGGISGSGTDVVVTAPTTPGTCTVAVETTAPARRATATLTVEPGPPDANASTVAVAPATRTVATSDDAVVRVKLRDAYANPTPLGTATLTLDAPAPGLGTQLGPVAAVATDRYEASWAVGTQAGTSDVLARLDGVALPAPATLTLQSGPASAATTQVSVVDTALPANGTATTQVVIRTADRFDNPLARGGDTITVEVDGPGSVTAATDLRDGRYQATYTAGTSTGPVTLAPRVNGVATNATASLTLTPGDASADTAQVTVQDATLPADGASTTVVTVQLFDAQGNPRDAGGANVEFAAPVVGTLGAVTDLQDGRYEATYTAGTERATVTLQPRLDGVATAATGTLELRTFYLDANGVTIRCPNAAVGDTGTVNGGTYVKRTAADLTPGNAATACTSGVTDLAFLFEGDDAFDAPIGHWDTASVTSLRRTFAGATAFDRDLGAWDVGNVTDLRRTFAFATSFDGNVATWDTANVTTMEDTFHGAEAFTGDVSGWNVASVTDMTGAFARAASFDRDLSSWCVEALPTTPTDFDVGTPATWTASEKPAWGTPCTP